MDFDANEFLGEFLEEMDAYLRDLDTAILNLEDDPENNEILNTIFRTAHSIKGMGAMMGFEKLEKLTHNMEDVLYDIRDGKAGVNQQVINLLFLCHDFLHEILLDISETGTEENIEMKNINNIIGKLHGLLEEREGTNISILKGLKLDDEEAKKVEEKINEEDSNIYYIDVQLEKKAQMKKVRSFMIINNLKSNGKIINSKPSLEDLKDDNFNMEGDKLYILISSDSKKMEILENIKSVPTVEKVNIDEVKNIDRLTEDQEEEKVDEFLEDELIGLNEVEEKNNEIDITTYEKEFFEEIKRHLENTKRVLLKINDEDNLDIVMKSYRSLKTVNRISELLGRKIIRELTGGIVKIIRDYQKRDLGLETELIQFILKIVNLGLRWVENPDLENNVEFITNVREEINQMQMYVVEKEVKADEKIGNILKKICNLTDEDIKELEKLQEENPDKKFGELAVENKNVKEEDTIQAVMIQNRKKTERKKREEKQTKSKSLNISNYIRVDSQKADELFDSVGELKIMQTQIEHSMVNEDTNLTEEEELETNMKNMVRMQRIIKKIQKIAMSFRMVALRSTFQKVNRTVRDTLKKLDKDVDFELKGEGTEIDKEIADKVLELIIHLVKNSISHGIEEKSKRKKLGKPEKGKVKLEAYQKKGFIHINITDDGKGIDPDAIYKSAKQKGLVNENKEYTDSEKIDFIFYPGFSTAEQVGTISGRGVGMDVVKTELAKMGGKIDVETKIGKGSNFEMKIPINMSIIDGTLVKISGETYIVPTNSINEIVPRDEDYWVDVQGQKRMVKIREKLIPVIDLEKVFGKKLKLDDYKMLLILEENDKLKAITVDDILERREIVEKPLGEEYGHVNYISGASILGDGKVSLILDVEKLKN
ncbi:MAG: chemotaxis protein CheW [Fusobacteriota bacterium]